LYLLNKSGRGVLGDGVAIPQHPTSPLLFEKIHWITTVNTKHFFRLSKKIVLNIALVILLISCLGEAQGINGIEGSSNSDPQQRATESLSSSVCEVREGESINAALNNPACKTITVHSGDYRGEGWYKLQRSDVTLQAEGEVFISMVIVYGDNNVLRGFTITDPEQKTCVRTYGDNNLIENNECYDTAEDGMWLWGKNNIIRGNYIHDIHDDRGWPDYDQHVDCFMTFSWDWPVENLLIDGNTCVLDRPHGSNQFFILTHNGNMPMKDITFRNNVFIAKDPGYVPIAFFGDSSVTGMEVVNNTFYNTTGQGDEAVWAENMPDVYIANNAIIGYDSVVRVVGSNVIEEYNYINPPYGMLDIQGFDFHLVPGSPLIDAGVALGIEYDFDGNPRDERPDIGAFEYQMP